MKTLPCLKSFLAISLFLGLSCSSFAQNNESAAPSDPTTSQTEEVDAALTSPSEGKHLASTRQYGLDDNCDGFGPFMTLPVLLFSTGAWFSPRMFSRS